MSVWRSTQLCLFALMVSLVACSNTGDVRRSKNKGLSEDSTTSGKSTDYVHIARVVKGAGNNSAILNLVGDGDGKMGTACALDANSVSTCQCVFRYVLANGSNEENYNIPIYVETEFVRCDPASILPPDANQPSVLLRHVSGQVSNVVALTAENLGSSVDPTLARSFRSVDRFQGRPLTFIPSVFGSDSATGVTMYDPIQSVAPWIIPLLNYYTTDMGSTLLKLAIDSGNSSTPNPAQFEYSKNNVDPTWWDNRVVYDGSGEPVLPKGVSAFDHETFHLARGPTGLFNKAIYAKAGPQETTTGLTTLLGYGATPTQSGGCPTQQAIPAGYEWVKVWSFYVILYHRSFLKRSDNHAPLLACNMGRYPNQTQNSAPYNAVGDAGLSANPNRLYDDCEMAQGNQFTQSGFTMNSRSSNGTGLAARVLKIGGTSLDEMCFSYQGSVGSHATLPAGSDNYRRFGGIALGNYTPITAATITSSSQITFTNGTFDQNQTSGIKIPVSGSGSIGVPYPDYLFYVTLPSENASGSTLTVYRDCKRETGSACAASSRTTPDTYSTNSSEISSSSQNSQTLYPVCAIRPILAGASP